MKICKRLCVEAWSVTAQNGDHFEVIPGKDYTTSEDREDGTCVVFSRFWVAVPLKFFTRKRGFPLLSDLTEKLSDAEVEYRSWLARTPVRPPKSSFYQAA